jgi:hypothetical protein
MDLTLPFSHKRRAESADGAERFDTVSGHVCFVALRNVNRLVIALRMG